MKEAFRIFSFVGFDQRNECYKVGSLNNPFERRPQVETPSIPAQVQTRKMAANPIWDIIDYVPQSEAIGLKFETYVDKQVVVEKVVASQYTCNDAHRHQVASFSSEPAPHLHTASNQNTGHRRKEYQFEPFNQHKTKQSPTSHFS
jgi:hypothetical protein